MMEDLLCKRYIDLRLSWLHINEVAYELRFDIDQDSASPMRGKPNVLQSIAFQRLVVDLGNPAVRKRFFRHVGSSMSQARMSRLFRALHVYGKFLGWPKIVLGPQSGNHYYRQGSDMHLRWDEDCSEIIDSLPNSAGEEVDTELPLAKAMFAIPDAPRGRDGASLALAVKMFRDLLLELCSTQIRRELDTIWLRSLELTRRLPWDKVWPATNEPGPVEVTTESTSIAPAFEEHLEVTDQELVSLSRGKLSIQRMQTCVRDLRTGESQMIHHGLVLLPTGFGACGKVVRVLKQEAVDHFSRKNVA